MSAGYAKDKQAVDSLVGELATTLNRTFRRIVQFNAELAIFSDAQLTAAGYSTGEITSLRAFAADAVQLEGIYRGGSTLGTAKDFRVSFRPLWGVVGDF